MTDKTQLALRNEILSLYQVQHQNLLYSQQIVFPYHQGYKEHDMNLIHFVSACPLRKEVTACSTPSKHQYPSAIDQHLDTTKQIGVIHKL